MTSTDGSPGVPDRGRRCRWVGLSVLAVLSVSAVLLAGLGTGVLLPAAGWPLLVALFALGFWLSPAFPVTAADRWMARGVRLAFLFGFPVLVGALLFGSDGLGRAVFLAVFLAVGMTAAYELIDARTRRRQRRRTPAPGTPGSRVPPLPPAGDGRPTP